MAYLLPVLLVLSLNAKSEKFDGAAGQARPLAA
jgi:hypothetical protein